jgi:hypothetical protein
MRLTLESTTKIVDFQGVKARLWQGKTENGIECHAFVTCVCVTKECDTSEFDRDLLTMKHSDAQSARMLLP